MDIKKKVLVIDDERADRLIIIDQLTKTGFDCEYIQADSGKSGLNKIKKENPDIVIIDKMMTGMNGFDVCRKIKEINRDIKVLIVTGQRHLSDYKRADEAGADLYDAKTVTNETLISSFQHLMSEQ